jgi:beta-lactamase class D
MKSRHPLQGLFVVVSMTSALASGCAGSTPEPEAAPAPKRTAEARFEGLRACFTMIELGTRATIEYGGDECGARTLPASTFKIPNALIALDTGVLKDESTVIPWDGNQRWNPQWNRDHALPTAMWYSVGPYFQVIAQRVGVEKYRAYLSAFQYGNADPSGDVTMFWLNGTLQISTREETRFLSALYEGSLPVSERAAASVKRILELRGEAKEHVRDRLPFVDEIPKWVVLSGKTGSDWPDEGKPVGPLDVVGWFVGALENDGHSYVFACRVRSGDPKNLGPVAAKIAYGILKDEGLLDAPKDKSN